LEVITNGQKVHSKLGGDGYLTEKNSLEMMRRLQGIVEGGAKTTKV
jgi:hypothetical protein